MTIPKARAKLAAGLPSTTQILRGSLLHRRIRHRTGCAVCARGPGVTTFLTEDQYSPTYAVVFSNNLPASVDMGIDMYVFKAADLSVYESAISVANYYQHQVFIEEFAAQDWVESGAPATEPCAIKGCYSCDWQTSQSDQNFVAAF